MPPTHRRNGATADSAERLYDRDRGNSAARGYDRQWSNAATAYRAAHPLCEYCEMEGRVAATALVDHLYPHRGDRTVFWLRQLWVASCTDCHSGWKQQIERQGTVALDALARRLGRPTLTGLLAAASASGGGSKV